jgi:hypothetical protein
MSSTGDLPDRPRGRAYGVPAERARIVEVLTDAYARDDLEQAEFERRVERAEEARTIEELEELVADFPEHVRTARGVRPTTTGMPRLSGAALEAEVARLDGLSAPTTFNLLGDKRVVLRREDPRVVRAVSIIGDCDVDLRGLAGEGGVVLVKVVALVGDTKIVVPRGTPVEVRLVGVIGDEERRRRGDGLVKKLARKLGVLEEPKETAPTRPGPTVVVTGFRLVGDTEIVEE